MPGPKPPEVPLDDEFVVPPSGGSPGHRMIPAEALQASINFSVTDYSSAHASENRWREYGHQDQVKMPLNDQRTGPGLYPFPAAE